MTISYYNFHIKNATETSNHHNYLHNYCLILPLAMPSEAFATSGAVTTPLVDITSFAAEASQVTYKVSFSVSSTGGLTGGQGTVDLIAPKGTVWPTQASDYEVEDLTSSESAPSNHVSIADNGAIAAITVPDSISNGDSLTVKVLGATNPVTADSYTIGVHTSSSDTRQTQSSPIRRYRVFTQFHPRHQPMHTV
ncbi:MAG: hypothetical protein M1456_07030 [Actinobacteria bacterium]|nr:hypothetical protein [Actinomycetota bacterium]MCL5885857.1 hypothetical protein [Actinomycetota bacterium]